MERLVCFVSLVAICSLTMGACGNCRETETTPCDDAGALKTDWTLDYCGAHADCCWCYCDSQGLVINMDVTDACECMECVDNPDTQDVDECAIEKPACEGNLLSQAETCLEDITNCQVSQYEMLWLNCQWPL
jgi:hypothetical protein